MQKSHSTLINHVEIFWHSQYWFFWALTLKYLFSHSYYCVWELHIYMHGNTVTYSCEQGVFQWRNEAPFEHCGELFKPGGFVGAWIPVSRFKGAHIAHILLLVLDLCLNRLACKFFKIKYYTVFVDGWKHPSMGVTKLNFQWYLQATGQNHHTSSSPSPCTLPLDQGLWPWPDK